ncbi:MAG: metallophosphoesterase [Desulfurococcales archaeon]|nr:metallophosphoesterase [Desulfurococcales archaeon]
MSRIAPLTAALLVTALVVAGTLQLTGLTSHQSQCCAEPLINVTAKPIPAGLSVYPVIVFGDNRPQDIKAVEQPYIFKKIVKEAESMNPFAVIGTGDHVGQGSAAQYEVLWSLLSGLENVWLTPGNHDLLISGSEERWEQYVGPRYQLHEEIPGWSIILADTYTGNIKEFNSTVHRLFAESKGPNRILVIHYPIKPHVDHNIDETRYGAMKKRILTDIIAEYNVSIVIQGHWHGYATKTDNGTLYVITGGAGAPFYTAPENTDADYYKTMVHNYVILLLKSNGEYEIEPVYADRGEVGIVRINSSTVEVWHTKLTLNGTPAVLPFRFTLSRGNVNITVVAGVEGGQNVTFSLATTYPPKVVFGGGVEWAEAYYTENMTPIPLTKSSGNFSSESFSLEHETNASKNTNTSGTTKAASNSPPTATNMGGGSTGAETSIRHLISSADTLMAVAVVLLIIVVRLKLRG